MANTTRGRSRSRPLQHPSRKKAATHLREVLLQREVWGLVLTAIGAITVIAVFSAGQGALSDAWALSLRQLFGIGAYVVALFCLLSGGALLFWPAIEQWVPRWQVLIGSELLFLLVLGLVHIAWPGSPTELAEDGNAGGFVGWALWQLLVPVLGRFLSFLFLFAIFLCGLYLVSGVPWPLVVWWMRRTWSRLRLALLELWARLKPLLAQFAVNPQPALEPDAPSEPSFLAPAAQQETAEIESEPRKRKAPRKTAPLTRAAAEASGARRAALGDPSLPPLDLLVAEEHGSHDESDARHRAQVIEETLAAFGIPARVVEWHRGPAVTQFGIEPGFVEKQDRDGSSHRFKVRVSKILSLSNDLALALAAPSLRIEAPVPGRPVIGIEVPNESKTTVGLRGVLESDEFQKMRAPLRIALGRDVSGQAVVANLAAMPHLLLAGATGSGKSVCLNAIIASLLFHNTPDELRLLMVDPKRVELTTYNAIPHLLAPVVVDVEKVIAALRWVTREMDRRYAEFASVGVRNLVAYNKRAQSKGLDTLPMVVVIIDELADLMLAAPDDVEQTLCRIAQMARATGIHLVVATQRPSVDVVTGLIKANFPARVSFAVTSMIDSRVILDSPGAEKLLGRGDMLFMAPDSPKLQRIQGCWVSDKELEALVRFWRGSVRDKEEDEETTAAAPWDGMEHEDAAEDGMFEQAVELVRQHQQASASFLQRQMRIGYPRAARLVDQLEQRGVIGPLEAGGRSRAVLPEDDEEEQEPDIPDDGDIAEEIDDELDEEDMTDDSDEYESEE